MNPVLMSIVTIITVMIIGGGLVAFSLVNTLFISTGVNERLDVYANVPEETSPRRGSRRKAQLTRLRIRANRMLSILASEEMALQLISANWPITETEYLLIRFWSTLGALTLGWLLFRSPISGVGLAAIVFLLPPVFLQHSIQVRRNQFERQLVDVLVLMTGAVRAGFSLQQALDAVIRELKPPASEEFHRVRQELGLGLPLRQALENLTRRMQNDDLYLVVTAININQQVGGNLVTMLEAVTETIRERMRLFGELRSLTAQQRFNSYLLTLLPIFMGAILFVLNPDYFLRLFRPGVWLCIPIGAVIGVILGNILVRRLAKIDV